MSQAVEFVNPNPFAVQLVGPNNETIQVPRYTKVILSDWYIAKYVPKFLKVVRVLNEPAKPIKAVRVSPSTGMVGRPKNKPLSVATQPSRPKPIKRPKQTVKIRKNRIVGRKAPGNPTVTFKLAAASEVYPISNNIGVGILSYNRLASLQRLVYSIRANTNLSRTTLFVSDESSLPEVRQWLKQQPDLIVVEGSERIGVAGNSNRLLRCLSRFKYKILLNDDVEILQRGWDSFYFDAMARSGIHHFCFRQPGVYGAKQDDGIQSSRGGITISTISDKPQGSIIVLDQLAFEAIGYFDESFGLYGMEHVDWSNRLSLSGIQPAGFHDVVGASNYFKIWAEKSAVEDRTAHLLASKELYQKLSAANRRFVNATNASDVPSVSYVIPCRNITERNNSIPSVIANIRAQRFPNIEIILSEQDWQSRLDHNLLNPYKYFFAQSTSQSQPFNKSVAFNLGVMNAKNEILVLHDADILVPASYTSKVYNTLTNFESAHFGKQVLYLTRESTADVNSTYEITPQKQCDRAVDYFEGGSLCIRKSAYIKIGGFNERFVGYGLEDCEFYERMKAATNFNENRDVMMVHMWHDRVGDWQHHHKLNRIYFDELQNKYSIDERCSASREFLTRKYNNGG